MQFVREKATRAPLHAGETIATRIRCVLQSDARSALCYRLAAKMYMGKAFAESPGAALHCLLLTGEHSGALRCVRALKSNESEESSSSRRRGGGRKTHESGLALEQTESASELMAMRLRMRMALAELSDAQRESLLRERAALLEALATCPSADAARAVLETGLCSLCELLPLLGGENESASATGLPLLTDLLEHSLGHLVEGAVADERRADELLEANWEIMIRGTGI